MQRPGLTRPYFSEPFLNETNLECNIQQPIHSKSEPLLSELNRKKHPLLNQSDLQTPHNYHEYLFAAENLENIVSEGAFLGSIKSKFRWFSSTKDSEFASKDISDRVLKLVYGTIKYLPYIDHILVKTQFLVFNNQFLDSLGLVKIMLFDLMTHHFDYKLFGGIDYTLPQTKTEQDLNYQKRCIAIVKDLEETLYEFQVKLGAAYARLRIEKQARGENCFEQMHNMLPPEVRIKEEMAVDMIQTLKMNTLKYPKKEIAQKFKNLGFHLEMMKKCDFPPYLNELADQIVYLDNDFDELLIIPPSLFADIKSSTLLSEGYLIFQDKASMYCCAQLKGVVKPGDKIIDARGGCGTKLSYLSEMVGKKGHIFVFEHRPTKLETLNYNIKSHGCKNVTIIEEEFILSDVKIAMFSDVTSIIVEPANSGTTIIDKLGFMLQEEEYPVDQLTLKDLYTLKRQQIATLKHAFKYPKVQNIIYTTRSTHSEENEQVVTETLDRYGVEWKLSCVLPDIPSEKLNDDGFEIDECLTLCPSEKTGNGVFVANFQLKPLVQKVHRQEDPAAIAKRLSEQTIQDLEASAVIPVKQRKKKPTGRKRGEPLRIRLPKALRASVNRLSVPRLFTGSKSTKETHVNEAKSSSIRNEKDIKHEDSQEEALHRESLSHDEDFAENRNIDVGVYGISIKKFFNPRSHALNILKVKDTSLQKARWSYPVPNPTVWK